MVVPAKKSNFFCEFCTRKPLIVSCLVFLRAPISNKGKGISTEFQSVANWLEKPINFDRLLQALDHIKKRTHPELLRVLHVEDNPDTCEVVRTFLENKATVVSVSTISETEVKMTQSKFDLVIQDLLLPDGNAEKIIPLLAELKLPVIAYSSLKMDQAYTKEVKHVLLKSEPSNTKLLDLIKRSIRNEHVGDYYARQNI